MITKQLFLTQLFDALAANNICYFVYGEYKSLPKDTGNSDLDIMVESKDYKSMCSSIMSLAKENDVILASYYSQSNSSMFRFLTKDWGLQIDVFKEFYYRGVIYYYKKLFTSDIIIYNNIKVLSIEKGYYVDFFKEVIHNGTAKEKYIHGFLGVIKSNPDKYYAEIEDRFGVEVVKLIFNNLSVDELKVITTSLQKKIHAKLFKNRIICKKLFALRQWKRVFSPPGYTIAVLGTDGSGKSTIINAITPVLNEAFHNTVVYNHLRPHYLPDLGVTLKQREKSDTTIVNCDPHAKKRSGFIGSLMRWGYYLVDYSLGYLLKIFPSTRIRSKVFIFDRYYYDYYIDQKRSRINLPKWIIKVGECIVPTPDLVLCLGGDPKVIYERKPETSLEEVNKQTSVLKEFCDKHKKAVWVDTSVAPKASVDCAMNAICKCMDVRFKNINK